MQIVPVIPKPAPSTRVNPPEPSGGRAFGDAMRSATDATRDRPVDRERTAPPREPSARSAAPERDDAETSKETSKSATDAKPADGYRDDVSERTPPAQERTVNDETTRDEPADAASATPNHRAEDAAPDTKPGPAPQGPAEARPAPTPVADGDIGQPDPARIKAPAQAQAATDAPPANKPTGPVEPSIDAVAKTADKLAAEPVPPVTDPSTTKADVISPRDSQPAPRIVATPISPEPVTAPSASAPAPATPAVAEIVQAAAKPQAGQIGEPVAMTPAAAPKVSAASGDAPAEPAPTPKQTPAAAKVVDAPVADLPDDALLTGSSKPANSVDFGAAMRMTAEAPARSEAPPTPINATFFAETAPGQLQPATGLSGITSATGSVDLVSNSAAQTAYSRGAEPAQPPVQQVAVQISRAVQEGTDRVTVQLKPAALGRISIELEVGYDNRVIAVIAAERSDTMELLQRDSKALERALNDAGLKADSGSLSFSLKGEGGRQDNDGGEPKTTNGTLALPGDADGASPEPANAPYIRPTGAGSVDIRI